MGSLDRLECAARHPARIARIALVGDCRADAGLGCTAGRGPRQGAQGDRHDQHLSHRCRGTVGGNTVPGMWLLGVSRRLMERQQPGVLHNVLAACNAYTHGMDAAAALACPALIISALT